MHELGFLTFADCRGGRNGVDFPLALPETQVCEAQNVDWYAGMVGRRRRGAVALTGLGAAIASTIKSLHRFLPKNMENSQELFAFCVGSEVARGRFGVWTAALLPEPEQYLGIAECVSFNYKLFCAYKNASDKLAVYDPVFSAFRRVGLIQSAAPTVTSLGAGSITQQRWYAVAFTRQASGVTVARGDIGPQQTITVGAGVSGWTIGKPANAGSGLETHWEVYGAAANAGPYYLLQTLPLATATTTDVLPAASFPPLGVPLTPGTGSQTPLPNGRYLLVDGARVLVASSYTKPEWESRVWWSAILNDASGVNNDERVNMQLAPFIDFDPGEGGAITGIAGPLFDSPVVFKLERIYKMVRTGNAEAPYRPVTVSKRVGAIHHRTIVSGEDENGQECLYFLSRRGPYRLGSNGVEYLGRDIEDLWATVNLDSATMSGHEPGTFTPPVSVGAHGVYYHELHQVWWYVPIRGYAEPPTIKLVFDTRLGRAKDIHGVRGGWCQHNGASTRVCCSRMASDRTQVSASSTVDPLLLKPHVGYNDAPLLMMCDAAGTTSDNSEHYAAFIRTRAVLPSESVALHGGVIEGHLVMRHLFTSPSSGFAITAIRDFGIEARHAFLIPSDLIPMLGPVIAGNNAILPVRDLGAASAAVIQVQIYDWFPGAPLPVNWEINQIVLRIRREEDR